MTISSQEKTRNKLMDSMRKTKESATVKTEPAATTENVEKKQPPQSKRAVAKKPAKAATRKATKKASKKPAKAATRKATKKASKKPARTATRKTTKKAKKTSAGQYQSDRRVWPD